MSILIGRLHKMSTQNRNVSNFPNLKMSVRWVRSAGGRGAPGVAQRPTGDRSTMFEKSHRCFTGRQHAWLVERLSRLQTDACRVDRGGVARDHCDAQARDAAAARDKGKRGAELFVFDDCSLRDLAQFVEGPIRQFNPAVADASRPSG